mmetsp:Transcript_51526/g.159824  ORF Transcript_51526/g.159824 Transcript_51526/m.159824 type:complete len:81 (+) Transcript_51526:94-336(+)
MVSDRSIRLDNHTMRVVGQGHAYPMWLLKYTQPQPQVPTASWTAQKSKSGPPEQFFVVRDGAWVPEPRAPAAKRQARPSA